jgi:hypothetical protein
MLKAEGHTESAQLVDRAMNESRIRFGMSASTSYTPTSKEKSQLIGTNGGGGRVVADNTVKMDKGTKSIAMAMYGDAFNGDEKKTYAHWAKKVGLRAKKAFENKKRQSA